MLQANELKMAAEYQRRCKLPESLIEVDAERMAAYLAQHRERFLQLDIPMSHVEFVDDVDQLKEAQEVLSKASQVGLDLEWKSNSKSPSIIQVRLTCFMYADSDVVGREGFLLCTGSACAQRERRIISCPVCDL